MDITPSSTSSMGPPSLTAPSADRQHLTPTHQTQAQSQLANGDSDSNTANGNGSSAPAVGAAAAAQQPKVVQTAFIHKLYKWVYPRSEKLYGNTNIYPACSKIRAYSISFLGPAQMKASLCLLRANSQKFCRTCHPSHFHVVQY
jgi:hypothetical protein